MEGLYDIWRDSITELGDLIRLVVMAMVMIVIW